MKKTTTILETRAMKARAANNQMNAEQNFSGGMSFQCYWINAAKKLWANIISSQKKRHYMLTPLCTFGTCTAQHLHLCNNRLCKLATCAQQMS